MAELAPPARHALPERHLDGGEPGQPGRHHRPHRPAGPAAGLALGGRADVAQPVQARGDPSHLRDGQLGTETPSPKVPQKILKSPIFFYIFSSETFIDFYFYFY